MLSSDNKIVVLIFVVDDNMWAVFVTFLCVQVSVLCLLSG